MWRRGVNRTSQLAARSAARLCSSKGADTSAVRQAALSAVLKSSVYHSDLATKEAQTFFKMNLEDSYYTAFTANEIAEHIHGFIAGRYRSPTPAGSETFSYRVERDDEAFYICTDTRASMLDVDQRIESYLFRNSKANQRTHSISIRSYTSRNKPDGFQTNIVIYVVQLLPFITPMQNLKGNETIKQLTSEKFLKQRPAHVVERYGDLLNKLQTSFVPVYEVHESADGTKALSLALNPDRISYLQEFTQLIGSIPNVIIKKKFMETFANGSQVYTIYTEGETKDQLAESCAVLPLLPNVKGHPLTKLYQEGKISAKELMYGHAIAIYAFYFLPQIATPEFTSLTDALSNDEGSLQKLKTLRSELWKEVISEQYIGESLEANVDLFKELYADFNNKSSAAARQVLDEKFKKRFTAGTTMYELFATFAAFNQSVLKTNFNKVGQTAVSFRLDTSFFKRLDFPRQPFGLYLVVGAKFRGFHVRFSDIARGGIRLIYSRDDKAYRTNAQKLFNENFNLAFTQHKKNKDIPEGGSKGTILLDRSFSGVPNTPEFVAYARIIFMKYIDAMLDLMVDTPGVKGTLGNEILFFGPDENTAGTFPTEAALHARSRGYNYWKSLTTGKEPSAGGIPHDIYGMTTTSVRAFSKGIMSKLGLKEEQMTKLLTGGPNGDLGSNEIRMSKDITLACVDGDGVAYDPRGLDREEMNRLVKNKATIAAFDESKLSPGGFLVKVTDTDRRLPHGELVTNGAEYRDSFHLNPLVCADFFVPCGGRPEAVTVKNVHHLLKNAPDVTGEDMLNGKVGNLVKEDKVRFKYIVEGANLFITEPARIALENIGVIVFKDSSTNKGGVTSSSLEVLAGLALSDELHSELMCAKGEVLPAFYQKYVQQVVARVQRNAEREFECMWAETLRDPNARRTNISNTLSEKIVNLRHYISTSELFNNKELSRRVLLATIPDLLLQEVGIEQIMKRVPDNYLRAIFSAAVASDFVYSHGLQADDFKFFKYLWNLSKGK